MVEVDTEPLKCKLPNQRGPGNVAVALSSISDVLVAPFLTTTVRERSMSRRIHRIIWLSSQVACLAGVLMVLFAVLRSQRAEDVHWIGSMRGYYEGMLQQLHNADVLAKTGMVVASIGAIIMIGESLVLWRSGRASRT